jgi:polyisoprenoid-binding protein YceI
VKIARGVVLATAFAIAAAAQADSKQYAITSDGKNIARFQSEATLETITGTTTKVSGTIIADPARPEASTTDVSVDLVSLSTGISMRDNDMRSEKFVNTEKYPNAVFKTASVSSPVSRVEPNKPVDLKVNGDMTIHGVTKRMTIPVRVVLIPETDLTKTSRGPGEWIHATAAFSIKLEDFDIPVPEKLVLKLSDTVDVTLDVFALARPAAPAAAPAK